MPRIRSLVRIASLPLALVAALVVIRNVDLQELQGTFRAAGSDPIGLAVAVAAYSAAFLLRSVVWNRIVPTLPVGHAWSAIHLGLAANHLLPLKLGEAIRPVSAARRTRVSLATATASTVAMRSADILSVAGLAAIFAPSLASGLAGSWTPAIVAGVGIAWAAGMWWLARTDPAGPVRRSRLWIVLPGALAGWLLESLVMFQAVRWAGLEISLGDAVLVTAMTIAAQVFAVAPGGIGTYEAAGTAALVGLGAPAAPALAAVISAHALKTAYSFATGAVACFVPSPGALGRLRLSPAAERDPFGNGPRAEDAPIVLFLPAHNEAETIGRVLERVPGTALGRKVVTMVIDDGSEDATAAIARARGALVFSQPGNLGLGAAVRRGLAEAVRCNPAAVAFCDADGEYAPEELARICSPIIENNADYVIGSRFRGEIRKMLPHRRFGNLVLTRALSLVARRRMSDGQSGYRALSAEAARSAEVIHDYNYAQVLTLDLLGKGFRYAEVPITYSFRESGRSFVKLHRYLTQVIPAVHREVNGRT